MTKDLCETCKQANRTCPIYRETTKPINRCIEYVSELYNISAYRHDFKKKVS